MSFHAPQQTVVLTTNTGVFEIAADVQFTEEPNEILMVHTGAAGVIEYSFNGRDVHGSLTLGSDTSSIVETCTDRNIWFRRQAAGAGVCQVAVTAARTL
jgi:hypothetical protein